MPSNNSYKFGLPTYFVCKKDGAENPSIFFKNWPQANIQSIQVELTSIMEEVQDGVKYSNNN